MANKLIFFGVSVFLIFAAACSTTPMSTTVIKPLPTTAAPPPQEHETSIDYLALKKSLGLDRSADSLGIAEKPFNSCGAGYGYSNSNNCRRLYFTVIHVQLLCRDSEGTVSTGIDRADQTAISNRDVIWTLKGSSGRTRTDSDGFLQILSVNPNSQQTQRLKLSVGNDFLYMRANEITKVVTPKSWCNSLY
jgi:hypothetical protein